MKKFTSLAAKWFWSKPFPSLLPSNFYLLIFAFCLPFLASFQKNEEKKWLSAEAKKGETTEKLLERYGLGDQECDRDKFFKLNKKDSNFKLTGGKSYVLPIQIVKYNSKSIRTTLGIDDFETAKRIQKFNEKARTNGLRKDNFIDSKELWVPFHELACGIKSIKGDEHELAQKTQSGKRVFDIFGPKYAKTPLLNSKLKGRVFYIIAGHGGIDAGATARIGKKLICEDEYAYDVALRLARSLLQQGATTYVIVRDPNDGIRDDEFCKCDEDEEVWGGLPIPRSQKPRLFQRSDLVNALFEKNKATGMADSKQILVEIHVDSRSTRASTDVFFYHKIGSERGEKLANHVHRTFLLNYLKKQNRKYRGTVTARDLHTLRESKPTGLYVELGNIRNAVDQQRLLKPANRQAVANWLFEAVASFK